MNLSKKAKKEKLQQAWKLLASCILCPRKCRVNRLKGQKGYCGVGQELEVTSFGAHFGEEDVLVGKRGSGAIFLNSCNLSCVFCQNYDISQLRQGHRVSEEEFVQIILGLQQKGCHNINFVTPTHFMPQILRAIFRAQNQGLNIPLVYNSGGYETVHSLRVLEGVIDIYLPDIKYASAECAQRYSYAEDYPEMAKAALQEMYRQVGDLIVGNDGLAAKGLLIRHLVLPNNLSGTETVLKFIASHISLHSYINIMDQYRPCFRASDFPELSRAIFFSEFSQAIATAKTCGLYRLQDQVKSATRRFSPQI